MNARQICNALTDHGAIFNRRTNVAVPNVSWGWDLDYEADLIVVRPSMWCDEIEIKISSSDLRNDADKQKWKKGLDSRIHRFWYAVPKNLEELALKITREDHGVIVVDHYDSDWVNSGEQAKVVRRAKPIESARKVTEAELALLLRLGVMRYWSLRLESTALIEKVLQEKNDRKLLEEK